MHLDDYTTFPTIDKQDMLGEIDTLPDQLISARELGQNLPFPTLDGITQILIAGMGGSAIGADLFASYAVPYCPVPIFVHRNYYLPAWARGEKTLVITSSHSGNTEETLSIFEDALANNCHILTISTGGKLAELAEDARLPLWTFEHYGQPRAAVGYSFGLLLAAFARLGLIPNPSEELAGAVSAMRAQQENVRPDVPIVNNPAKRFAGQIIGRWVSVFGADVLEPVARRWKGQLSEVAKAWAQFEFLPESDHNTVAGVVNPQDVLMNTMNLFLRAPSYHPRNRLRTDLTKKIFMLEGLGTDFVDAGGETPLAHQWTALHLGDYTAYYLAMLYDVDPTPVGAIEGLKGEMRAAG
jgi:glucose/mannose-6-phosphate isomerase